MLSLYEILKASKTGVAPDMWTALAGKNWGGADSGHEVKELTGTPPLSFRADGTPLLDYTIYGNTVQSGTPTPTTPIQPQECGERTGNLWQNLPNRTSADVDISSENGVIYFTNTATSSYNVEYSINLPAGTYTIKANANRIPTNDENACIQVYNGSAQLYTKVSNNAAINGAATFTINQNLTVSLRIRLQNGVDYTGFELRPTLNSGSTAMDFEPYGYKIPISSANITTPIYLGEVPTTRRIKELVLTGEEEWYDNWRPVSGTYASMLPSRIRKVYYSPTLCTHIEFVSYQQIYDGTVGISTVPGNLYLIAIRVPDTVASNIAEFKAYLAAQYAAGTPVTVWYVLAEPTTGIVNEPLRKIDDYADTLSMEQAGVQIPTNRGNTVIDVLTELKPSEVYIKYKG